MMMNLVFLAYVFGHYAVTVAPTTAAFAVGSRRDPRLRFNGSDAATLLVPFALWLALFVVGGADKSLANLVEAFWLGVVVSILQLGAWIHAWRRRIDRAWPAFVVLVLGCLAALVIWAFVPGVPQ